MVLALWMYADVPATNVLAPDRERVLAALDDPAMLRRLLYAKNLALWCFVAPFCAVVALLIGFFEDNWPPVLVSITAIAVVPFGALASRAGWGSCGRTTPRVRFRWVHRRDWWHMICAGRPGTGPLRRRTGARRADPHAEPAALVDAVGPGLSRRLPTSHFAGGVALAGVVSLVVFRIGPRSGSP